MDQMLHVSSNPHVRDKMTTSKIMQLVVLALLPTTLFGIYNFGLRALLVVVITVASSVTQLQTSVQLLQVYYLH